MRLHLDGERILRASQGEAEAEAAAILDPTAHTPNSTTNRNTANISRHSRFLSPEGWNLVFSPPRLCTFEKSLQLIANIFFKMHLCLFRKSRRRKEKAKGLPGSTRIYAKVEKRHQLFKDSLHHENWQQIFKIQETCRHTKHLHCV